MLNFANHTMHTNTLGMQLCWVEFCGMKRTCYFYFFPFCLTQKIAYSTEPIFNKVPERRNQNLFYLTNMNIVP